MPITASVYGHTHYVYSFLLHLRSQSSVDSDHRLVGPDGGPKANWRQCSTMRPSDGDMQSVSTEHYVRLRREAYMREDKRSNRLMST